MVFGAAVVVTASGLALLTIVDSFVVDAVAVGCDGADDDEGEEGDDSKTFKL